MSLGFHVLVVDDEAPIRLTLSAILELRGFIVRSAASAAEALARPEERAFDLVVTDMRMERDASGYQVLPLPSARPAPPAVLIVSAYPSLTAEWQAKGADGLLVKPTDTVELLRQVDTLLAARIGSRQARAA